MDTRYHSSTLSSSKLSHFDASAKTFVPSKQFDPFEVTSVEVKQDNKEDEEDPEIEELSHHYLNSNLLDEDELPLTASKDSSFVWSQKNDLEQWKLNKQGGMEDIWKQQQANVWDSFEPYSRGNEQDFDPTLQFYHGSLYDVSTIEDMNLLKGSCPSTEEIQVENVAEDMSTLQMLQTIFSDLSEQKLLETLKRNDYDLDRSIESLLTKQVNVEPVDTKKRQVCRHFLAGECYRKDCWFVHDLQEKVCKFWLQGSCLKGKSCEFSHHLDIKEMMVNKINNNKPSTNDNKPLNLNEYPALGSCIKPRTTTVQAESKVMLEEEFPSLASAVKIKNNNNSVKAPVKVINFAEITKKKPSGSPTTTYQNKKKQYGNSHQKLNLQKLKQPVHIPWLETGSSLNSTYMKEREKAIEYGDGSKAKLYSMEAKHYNRLMQEMHMEASRRIFEQRSKHEAFIDLHGLHQDEAIHIIEERLDDMRRNKYTGIVYIVTGTGHHSGASGLSKKSSKLKPFIEDYLRHENYRFAETNMLGDTKGGIFAVDLSLKK
ncbi:hypothetical protein G6F57_011742 [Rhizopus arrhizus]|uniref:Uncharacterized protein n=1 Tax=Rhizopus oryzae TaxID=64495 RepID=A0A9P7BL69_RHIOR|nr:hypothetical protein G6F30_012227 [Rhizopus arrhizus]KAG0984451.1 hypothetical protein G6F29_004758 [Rhizopus arrhizus]KAG0991903.1 hypothetical protein G6F28_008154 [Rhizopus arrhizus]KAG1005936.1 hypothetical protein G6F27_008765 [Rhizopus arrhizus]KAG1016688.1 hypothetical protein G6F26_012327 [Rhizopus arrhizus]